MPSALLDYKSKQFWLLFLFLAYSLFGWFAVPYIVKQQTISSLKDLASWDTRIESVVFNPYALSLAMHGVEIDDRDKQKTIAFERLFVNFSALQSITGTISFDEISLSAPLINIDIDKSGKTNFERAFIKSAVEAEPPVEEDSNSKPLAFSFGLIAISAGELNLSDNSTDERFQLQLEPLNLALKEFSTNHNDGGSYSLDISLGKGQELSWSGRLGIAPFTSKGQLKLTDIHSSSFWHYAKAFSPYWLENADISLDLSYDTEFSEERSQLVIDTGSVAVNNIKLAEAEASESFFNLNSISLSPLAFDLAQRSANLGMLSIDSPELSIIKDAQATLNLQRPIEAHEAQKNARQDQAPEATEDLAKDSTATATIEGATDGTIEAAAESTIESSTEEDQQAFSWSLAGIELSNGRLNWQDISLESPADLVVDQMSLKLGKISHELDKPFSYQFQFNTGDKTQHLGGNLAALPFSIDGDLKLDALPLTWLQPYINENVNAQLESGYLNLGSHYTLAQSADTQSTEARPASSIIGQISADVSLLDIKLTDSQLGKPLAGFDLLSVSGIDLALQSDRTQPSLHISEIKLSQPFAKALISSEGVMNLSALSKSSDASDEAQTEPDKTAATSATSTTPTTSAKETPNKTADASDIRITRIAIEDGRFDFVDASQSPVFNTYLDQVSGEILNISSEVEAHSKVDISGKLESYGKLAIQGTLNPLSPRPNSLLKIQVSNIDLSNVSPYSAKYAGYLIDKGKLDLDLSYALNDTRLEANNHIFIDKFDFGDSVDSPDATSLPLPLAIGIMKNLDGEIDIDMPISGDLDDPSFSIGGVVLTAFTNLITKVVTSPFSILGALVEGGDDISSVNFPATSSELPASESAKIIKLASALNKRPSLNLEVRGSADASLDVAKGQTASKEALIQLAKQRARNMTHALVEQGGIEEQRIFVLDPQIIAKVADAKAAEQDKDNDQTNSQALFVPSTFTIGLK